MRWIGHQAARALAVAAAIVVTATLLAPAGIAAVGEVVYETGFEDGAGGWFGRGSATLETTTGSARTGAASLLVTGRDATWQGPALDVSGVLEPGAMYHVETWVRLPEGTPDDLVTLTVQRTPAGADTAYDSVAYQVPVSAGAWTEVSGSYSYGGAVDELQLYLESPTADLAFLVDDVSITVTADPPSEEPVDGVVLSSDFEDGTTQGWGLRGPETVAVTEGDAHGGARSLLVSGRTDAWNGPARAITSVTQVGVTYQVEAWLRLAPGQDPADLRVSVQRDAGGSTTYSTVLTATATADEWVRVSGSYTETSASDAVTLYVESVDALVDFRLDDVTLTALQPPEIEDLPPLKGELAEDFVVGAAVEVADLVGPSGELLSRHFAQLTAGNAMKPDAIQPAEGTFTFTTADRIVGHARANDMRVYGHTFVWHSQTPDWFFEDGDGQPLTRADRDLALARMRAHIEAIAAHYDDGEIWAFDVVNEVIDETQPDGLRRSPWYEIVGPDYIDHAFRFARAAFGPDVKLFINDYNTEFPAKRAAYHELVSRLVADGVPIDGVGHQLHVDLRRPVSLVDETLTRFDDLGLLQAVTELDVSTSLTSTEQLEATPPARLIEQGWYYRDLFEVLRAHSDDLASVTVWGLSDARSWLRTWPVNRPQEAPLLFDDRLQAKPAYYGIVDPDSLCDSVVAPRSGPYVAEDRACVEDGAELRGAVTVADGAHLLLDGAVARGSVTVGSGGSLVVAGSEVRGPVTVEPGGTLSVSGSILRGGVTAGQDASVALARGAASGQLSGEGTAAFVLLDLDQAGEVVATGTTGTVSLTGNQIRGRVTVDDSATAEEPVTIAGNTIRGDLRCSGNEPAPTADGSPNTVTGGGSGQCAAITTRG
jgi:endo-1,4-beta-xylanase